jgi:hypothetical protein
MQSTKTYATKVTTKLIPVQTVKEFTNNNSTKSCFLNHQNVILQSVFFSDNKKENWRTLTNKQIYAIVKKTHHNRDNKAT